MHATTKGRRVMIVEYPNMIWKGQDICAARMQGLALSWYDANWLASPESGTGFGQERQVLTALMLD